MRSADSFGKRTTLSTGSGAVTIFSLIALEKRASRISRLPFSLKILLENLLRQEDGRFVKQADIEALAKWTSPARPSANLFMPARVLLQDFTGVPCVVDLAAMRDGIVRLGGDPNRVNPLQPVELVIDHSCRSTTSAAECVRADAGLEFSRNKERYAFLRWDRTPSATSVSSRRTPASFIRSSRYLARVVMDGRFARGHARIPDTLVGTDRTRRW